MLLLILSLSVAIGDESIVVPPRTWVDSVVQAGSDTIVRSLGGEAGWTMVDAVKPFEGLWREPFVTRFSSDSAPIRTPLEGDAAGFLATVFARGESAVLRVEKLDLVLRGAYAELLGDAWPRVERGEWTAHLYASSPRMAALRNHSDVDDIVVFQLAGDKTWTYCMPDKVTSQPILGKLDQCMTYSADEMDVIFDEAGAYNDCWVDTMRAGDALRVPRRTVHSARAAARPSLHLTVALVESHRRLTTTYEDPCEGTDDCFCDLAFPNTTQTCGREEDVLLGPLCIPGTSSQFGVYVAEFEGACNSGCDSSCDAGCDNAGSNCDSSCDDSCDRECDSCTGCQVKLLAFLSSRLLRLVPPGASPPNPEARRAKVARTRRPQSRARTNASCPTRTTSDPAMTLHRHRRRRRRRRATTESPRASSSPSLSSSASSSASA